jgi:hypothetical protein
MRDVKPVRVSSSTAIETDVHHHKPNLPGGVEDFVARQGTKPTLTQINLAIVYGIKQSTLPDCCIILSPAVGSSVCRLSRER